MLYLPILISIAEVLIVTVPVLLTVAFVTVAERKTMASMQRRLGPNIVGYYGLLQAFADALKLLLTTSSPPKPHAFISLPVQSGLPLRKSNRLWAFIIRIRDTICTKKFIYSSIIIFFTGFISRYIILVYFDVNVFTDIFNKISIIYYFLMSINITLVRTIISELYGSTILLMVGDPVGGSAGGGNNPSGVDRGSGSGAGRGAGNSPAAGTGSSSDDVPESTVRAAIEATKKVVLEEAIEGAKIETEQRCKSLSMSDSEIEKAKLDIEQYFRSRVERIRREGPTSIDDHATVEAERGLEERLRLAFKEQGMPNHDDDDDDVD